MALPQTIRVLLLYSQCVLPMWVQAFPAPSFCLLGTPSSSPTYNSQECQHSSPVTSHPSRKRPIHTNVLLRSCVVPVRKGIHFLFNIWCHHINNNSLQLTGHHCFLIGTFCSVVQTCPSAKAEKKREQPFEYGSIWIPPAWSWQWLQVVTDGGSPWVWIEPQDVCVVPCVCQWESV